MASVCRSGEVITDWNPCRNNTSGSMSQNVENYTLISASIHDFFICQNRRTPYQPWDRKSLTPCRSLWSWCSLLRGTEKIQLYLGQWKGREGEGCWYTKTICGENQPWQHYSFSVEWRYPGSCVTLLLHHCSHIPPKPHYCWSMLPLSHLERNDLLESDIFSADFRAKASMASSPLWDYTLGVEDDL